jgi:hypothetical protein
MTIQGEKLRRMQEALGGDMTVHALNKAFEAMDTDHSVSLGQFVFLAHPQLENLPR